MWDLRTVPTELRERYLAEGWWTDLTFAGFMERQITSAPDLTFRVWSDTHPHHGTIGALYEQSARLAGALAGLGVGPGDRVVYQIPNWLEAGVAICAAFRLGAVAVPIVPFYGAREVEFILRQTGAKALITVDRFGHVDHAANLLTFRDHLPALEHVVVVPSGTPGPTLPGALDFAALCGADPFTGTPDVDPDAPAMVGYTSGTTAEPKGVIHSHRTLLFEVVQLDALAPDAHADAQVLCPFVHSLLDAQALARFPDLRLVATRSTGFDHIDLGACAARGILVCNVPDYGDRTVAEHTFALLLAVSRRLVEAVDATRRGEFSGERLRGFDLAGRTIGVIGAGRIGRRVLAIARGFGMEALACDPAPDAALARAFGFAYASLDDLLARADVVSLHAPGGAATRGMIGRAQIARMKQGAVLINTARGDLVDVSALADALALVARRGGDFPRRRRANLRRRRLAWRSARRFAWRSARRSARIAGEPCAAAHAQCRGHAACGL